MSNRLHWEPRLPDLPREKSLEGVLNYIELERSALFEELRGLRNQVRVLGAGGAFYQAQYVTMASSTDLTSERVLTAGTGITITDGGAGSTVTVSSDPTAASSFAFLYGNGADGTAVLDGTNTFSWASKSGSVYTLTRNVALSSLTVDPGVALKTDSWALLCTGTITNNGVIGNSGANGGDGGGAGGTGGGGGTASARFLGVGQTGGAGGASNSLYTPSPTTYLCGGFGGVGGTGSGGSTAGVSGSSTLPPKEEGGLEMVGSFHTLATGQLCFVGSSFNLKVHGGGGGSGGAGNNSVGGGATQGGGGGGGGGAVLIHAKTIAGSGALRALGGNGGNAAITSGGGGTGGSGGGGGGGGGVILVITETSNWQSLWTVSVAGGTGGNGIGTGTAGANGASGLIFQFIAQV